MFKGFTHKLSLNASTVITFVAALGYLAYLNSTSPDKVGDQLPLVLAAAGAVARLLYQVDEAKAKATEAATVATESKADNADALATIVTKVDENTAVTDTVHGAVNGQMKAFRQNVERTAQLEVAFAEIQAKLDAALARAAGITEGRAQGRSDATIASTPAEPQADGSILVEAPAVIHVTTPEDTPT